MQTMTYVLFLNTTVYLLRVHYIDAIMTTMASQITSLTVVYWIVIYAYIKKKYQSSASLAFVRGIHRDRWIPRTKGQWRRKCFHLMTSSYMHHFGLLSEVSFWDPTHLELPLHKGNTIYCMRNPKYTTISWQLTHWGRDTMDAITQTTFSNGISWMKLYEFRLKFHWSSFLGVQLTIVQHWFR